MEDTLREIKHNKLRNTGIVLILVLMEDTLRVENKEILFRAVVVLILVLMEDTLRVTMTYKYQNGIESLNPCFNGRYSQRYT